MSAVLPIIWAAMNHTTHSPALSHLALVALPAFDDNYIWMLHDGQRALVVDPGDSDVVLAALNRLSLRLETILVTHHHIDHTGGVDVLRNTTGAAVFGPLTETMPEPIRRLTGSDKVQAMGLTFDVIDVPGHTSGHIAFYCDSVDGKNSDTAPLLFCGDTMFSGGCGRLFEGTPTQMLASLTTLADLPSHTRVCCTHEYTLSNLKFARAVEPNNAELIQYQQQCVALREANLPTLPSTIARELQINPFLRSDQAEVIQAAQKLDHTATEAVAVFTAIRQWKNNF
jgi:hydroxyacylglutathione hydrolase